MLACVVIQAYSYHQPKPAARRTHSADLADLANSALVLSVILRAIEGTSEASLSRINRCVRGTANIEFTEGVEFDVDCIVGRAFADGFDFASLKIWSVCTRFW